MSIVVDNLLKTYGTQKAVDHISFAVEQGEIVGFLGPNGAGKSTTMKMITGYLKPDKGSALIAGINVADEPIAAKHKIGYLPEANPLYFDMYVKEYLEFIAGVHRIKSPGKRIDEVIELTGLTLERRKKIGQLSKGYKQRVGLSAALLHDPEVLILDEPTSGLDPNQIIEIRNVIKAQGKTKTVLFSSHILQEVEAICDRVIIINKGKLVANDKLSVLQQQGSSSAVLVSFKEPLEQEWLRRIRGTVSVEKVDTYSWKLQATDPNEVKKGLLELSLQHNLNIVSLHTEGGSLEEVFRSLTTSPVAV
ncbi:gliding motility-associated ABC transporter ATP-binding subunit GldA [Segetibacter sp. 3557_3]|uniref:gliding motility-associated ABC transporter ATP-binding subunit GldA n=1 Tax=Segetibacter sp. 3557_3 TaxID=2547429 RepID=UPI001058A162|nr:gliding motility-associated ABC transporter ATP-binding subunit GldA [Segetibacter sp. 3557_3]TDH20804.1 gliding motility-associated ABC transporter ATP-binding subunit GldA [Segetibacter sp. 3557_3]